MRSVTQALAEAPSGLVQLALSPDVGWQKRALRQIDALAGVEPERGLFTSVLSWLLDVDDEWDRQMAKDAASGKLDFLIEEARTAVREESLRDWPKPKT